MGDCACDVSVSQLEPATPISTVYLELTPACNNACAGCSNIFAHEEIPSPLTAKGWEAVFEKLMPCQPRLRLTGGEPTLRPDFAQILGSAERMGFPFTIFTNARWSNPEQLVDLLGNASGLECLLVSLHGATASSHQAFTGVQGSSAETLANIRRATQAGLSVTTSTVITHQNHHEIEAILALGRKVGAHRSVFSRYIGPPLPGLEPNPPELRLAVQEVERHRTVSEPGVIKFGTPIPHCFEPNSSNGCMAGFAHITIDPWGNVRPCPHVSMVVGNILEAESLDAILQSQALGDWRAEYLDQCGGCSSRSSCFAQCQALRSLRADDADPLVSYSSETAECTYAIAETCSLITD
jgi:AdoMet-dependent heme synthase